MFSSSLGAHGQCVCLTQVSLSSAGRYQNKARERLSVAINHPHTNTADANANRFKCAKRATRCRHVRCMHTAPVRFGHCTRRINNKEYIRKIQQLMCKTVFARLDRYWEVPSTAIMYHTNRIHSPLTLGAKCNPRNTSMG